jgi:hypothetical protein
MSLSELYYPPPRFDGETGLASASFRPADHPPELTYPSGGTVHYLATHASTAGEFGLYRWEMSPAPLSRRRSARSGRATAPLHL